MTKRFWFTALALFVLSMATDFLLHGLLLHADYAQLPNLMRTNADRQTGRLRPRAHGGSGALRGVGIPLRGRSRRSARPGTGPIAYPEALARPLVQSPSFLQVHP